MSEAKSNSSVISTSVFDMGFEGILTSEEKSLLHEGFLTSFEMTVRIVYSSLQVGLNVLYDTQLFCHFDERVRHGI